VIRILLIANGVVSIATIAFMIIDTSWLMNTVGLIAYFTWNILMTLINTILGNWLVTKHKMETTVTFVGKITQVQTAGQSVNQTLDIH
jgi:hypothetical protein